MAARTLLMFVALAVALALGGWACVAEVQQAVADDAGKAPGADHSDPAVPSRDADVAGALLFRLGPGTAQVPVAGEDSFPVTIDRKAAEAAARSGAMTVVLPDGTVYPVRYERSESTPDGNWTFIGRVDTPAGALASVITFGRDGVFGTLPTPDGSMMKFTTRAGQTFLQPAGWSVPPGVDPSQHPDYVLPPPRSEASATGHPATAAPSPATVGQFADPAGGEVTITILAAYTRNLSQLRGSRAAVETEYRNLVALMDQAHIDSGTRARFEIAGFVELDYPADAWNQEARADIIDNTLPDGTDLHALRDQLAADLVALIRPYVDGDLTCGISQFPGDELEPYFLDRNTGYSVTAVESCAPLVLAHEIGHNLGLMHDRETVAGPHGATLRYGPYPFSFGHRQLGPPGFATVMAYDSESRPWIGVFSHPGTTLCGGAACGDAALADNVRSTNLIAESISRFRDPPGLISIHDALGYEYSSDLTWSIRVELSSPAPAGGVTFDVAVVGGSAEIGTDADVEPGVQLSDVVIPAGGTAAWLGVRVHADDVPEPTETIDFRLQDVRGNVVVRDDSATMAIVDHDRTVRVAGTVRVPDGAVVGEHAQIHVRELKDGVRREYYAYAAAPDFGYSLDVVQGAFLGLTVFEDDLVTSDVLIEDVDRPMQGIDLEPKAPVGFSGRLEAPGTQLVKGVPVILWNPRGDGSGYHINWNGSNYFPPYEMDVLPGVSMQLEVRHPPAPYVRQIVEVPPLAGAATMDVQLREVPSLTIPHVAIAEGTAADGTRTVLLTAALSVPRSRTGVTFDLVATGTADADDFQLPNTRISIPVNRTRVEVPIVIHGDDRSESDEIIELWITNVQGAAWNPGPGSLRIMSDDRRPGDGSCTGSTTGGAVRMCQ